MPFKHFKQRLELRNPSLHWGPWHFRDSCCQLNACSLDCSNGVETSKDVTDFQPWCSHHREAFLALLHGLSSTSGLIFQNWLATVSWPDFEVMTCSSEVRKAFLSHRLWRFLFLKYASQHCPSIVMWLYSWPLYPDFMWRLFLSMASPLLSTDCKIKCYLCEVMK